ncbi:sugar transferase [Nakamurella silvestris]|nr:sugar transferase [Nakamurella silvestris]
METRPSTTIPTQQSRSFETVPAATGIPAATPGVTGRRSGTSAPEAAAGLTLVESSSEQNVLDQPGTAVRAVPGWVKAYRWRVVATDIFAITVAVLTGGLIRFGSLGSAVAGQGNLTYAVVSCLLIGAWLAAIGIVGAWDAKVLGAGTSEYRRITNATLSLFGGISVLAYLGQIDIARGYLLSTLPLGLAAVLIGRWEWRIWLSDNRRRGHAMSNVLVIGGPQSAPALASRLTGVPEAGYRVTGLCLPGGQGLAANVRHGFPVVGGLDDISAGIVRAKAHVVAVAAADEFGPERVRELSWSLEGTGIRLKLAPSLMDVAGPRIHVKPIAGLPLMQVDEPRFGGPRLVLKTTMDMIGAAIGLLLLLPVLLVVALAIKIDDRGPVFFRQERVGRGGKLFRMWKFRSMRVAAEAELAALREGQTAGNTVMFKMKADPRVTSVGRILRRFSIDEIPQLLNVLTGQMSLVGPRPPILSETKDYENHVHRRFLVKPGLTGLWQVSGRSDLTWEESVRLDLYYVENWSPVTDVIILAKTAKAVLARSGAY